MWFWIRLFIETIFSRESRKKPRPFMLQMRSLLESLYSTISSCKQSCQRVHIWMMIWMLAAFSFCRNKDPTVDIKNLIHCTFSYSCLEFKMVHPVHLCIQATKTRNVRYKYISNMHVNVNMHSCTVAKVWCWSERGEKKNARLICIY